MTDDGTLGDRLRRKRRESSLTQEELAHASGVSQVMVAKIEQGRRQPRLTVPTRLAKALDIRKYPEIADIAKANRAFQALAVRHAAAQGITQFIDLGAG